ncbi:MAG: signal peptidase I [Candidatus Nanopelagicales bacterium]
MERTSNAARRRMPLILMAVAVVALLALPTIARTAMGIGITTVLTGSMRPAIAPGDLVVTRLSQASTIAAGDVVVANSDGVPIAHRVVETRPLSGVYRLTTKGDANALIDTDPVMASAQQEVPRVIGRVPSVGTPLAYLASPDAQRLAVTLLLGANLIALALFALGRSSVRRPEDLTGEDEGRSDGIHDARSDIPVDA